MFKEISEEIRKNDAKLKDIITDIAEKVIGEKISPPQNAKEGLKELIDNRMNKKPQQDDHEE